MTERGAPPRGDARDVELADEAERVRAWLADQLDSVELSTAQFPVEAEEQAAELERLAVEIGDEHLQLRSLLVQADVKGRGGQSVASGRVLRSVNRWANAHDDQYLLARSHRLLGSFFGTLGDDVAFLEHAMQSVELLAEDARKALRADHLSSLGIAQGRLGAPEEGRASFDEAERLSAELGDSYRQVLIVNNVAYLEYQCGEPDRALTAVERLIGLAEEHGIELDPHYLDTIARVYLEVGRFSEAEEILSGILVDGEAGRLGDADGVAEFTLTLAEVQRRRGATDEAEASLRECRELCEQRSLHGVLVRVHQEQAELYAVQGRFEEAFTEHKAFHRLSQQLRSDARLARARTLQTVFDYEQARRASERFEELAYRDPLTNLRNRRYVDTSLPTILESSDCESDVISVAFIDLDHFKRINDTLTHLVGDEVLRQFAALLADAAAEPSYVARMGGEEFLLVMPGADHEKAVRLVEELQERIRAYDWTPVTRDIPVRASMGLATALVRGTEQSALLAEADRNVYAAKDAGRDRVIASDLSA